MQSWALSPRCQRRDLWLTVAILLIVFASRVWRLPTLNMEKDEVWSVWQTLGNISQVVAWTPFDWSPFPYLMVDVWQNLTGILPYTLRLLPIFAFLVTLALLYRVTDRLYGARAALMTLLVCAALGYAVYVSALLRAYVFLMLFWILAFWLGLRYLERPTRRLGIALVVTLAAIFYTHVSGIFGIVLLCACLLILHGRTALRAWRWIALGLILCLPEAISKLSVTVGLASTALLKMNILQTRLVDQYHDFVGEELTFWVILVLLASAMILEGGRFQRRRLLLLFWMAYPILIQIPASFLGVFNPRHTVWVMFGIAMWIGFGLALLPRAAQVALGIVLSVVMFGYLPLNELFEVDPRAPLVQTFNALPSLMRTGDVVFIDPRCEGCANVAPEEWDYFTRAYFPGGLTFVDHLEGNRRVWYVSAEGKEDTAAFNTLRAGYALSTTVGAPTLLFRLYEAPPDPKGMLFANGMRFHGAELLDPGGEPFVFHEGETIRVRLWWSVDAPLPVDYSEGTYILGKDGGLASQFDGPPQTIDGPQQVSQWSVGRLYLEERQIDLPYPLGTGTQQLMLALYQWWDERRIDAPGRPAGNLLPITTINIKAW